MLMILELRRKVLSVGIIRVRGLEYLGYLTLG